MNVRSEERHYWKIETLDAFDGVRWVGTSGGSGERPPLPVPYNDEWVSEFTVTIRELETELFPVAGTPLRISSAGPVAVFNADGTVDAAVDSLDEGESYDVEAYVPDPSPEEMRTAPAELTPPEIEIPYTTIFLQGMGGPVSSDQIAASPYGRMLGLARRLARGQDTTYDVVRSVQRHLRSRYIYSERPPKRPLPLVAFLFRDKVGYCQQFSGAMALMLRMLDIPARVAGGFTPGSYDEKAKEYRVRDLDAHSWVEVWFNGLGWVPFDPTPSIAPADSQSSADAASASSSANAGGEVPDQRAFPEQGGGASGASDGDDGRPPVTGWLLLAALAVVTTGVLAVRRWHPELGRRGRPLSEEDDLRALRRALRFVGSPVPARLTLRELEARLERDGGPGAARYVRLVRQRRYARGGGDSPDGAARRDLRRALARGRGVRARVAALVALPPLSFRRG
jgi:transglutaminase-like putative cysteine protease